MNIQSIKYGRKKIQVRFEILKNLYGYFETEKEILVIDSRVKGLRLFNTIMHELFHLIIHYSGIKVHDKGEETIAQVVGDGYAKIFKQNPNLWDFLTKLIKG
jgi:Zn-dependent peptidase ImmA (M78 family)